MPPEDQHPYRPTPLYQGRKYPEVTPARKFAKSTESEVKINATLIKSPLYYFRVLGLAGLAVSKKP